MKADTLAFSLVFLFAVLILLHARRNSMPPRHP